MRKAIKYSVFMILVTASLLLMFNFKLKEIVVANQSKTALKHLDTLSTEEIEKNQKNTEGVSFDFEKVKPLDVYTVLSAIQYTDTAIGKISIPSVALKLAIFKGVSEEVISIGAGTMKDDQQMGEGNYSLASHYMNDPSALFSPLYRISIDDLVYITDMAYIYTYKVSHFEEIDPRWIEVIFDHENKKELTLITCVNNGEKRLVVHCDFIEKDFFSSDKSSFFN